MGFVSNCMKERIQCLFLALVVMAFRFSVPAAGEQATSDETPLLYFRVLSDGGSQTILPMSRGSARGFDPTMS